MNRGVRTVAVLAGILWREVIRRKDAYVLLVLFGAFLLATVSFDIFGLGGVSRFVLDVGLLMAWLFGWALAVTVTARQLPHEEQRGTIFPLLAKPVTRLQLLVGKWLGAWTVVTAATLAFYGLVLAVVALRGGKPDPAALAQAAALHAVALGATAAIALWLSARMNADAASWAAFVLTGVAFALTPRIPELLARERGLRATLLLALYHLLPHFEVLDLRKRVVHDYGPAPVSASLLAAVYGAALIAFFLFLAWLAYRNKPFNREDRA
jgi:ABC-type transport system involved in multi-copper enzyme maturation permease subunit